MDAARAPRRAEAGKRAAREGRKEGAFRELWEKAAAAGWFTERREVHHWYAGVVRSFVTYVTVPVRREKLAGERGESGW
jgi:hypothetical protein